MKQNYYPKVGLKGRVRVCLETLTALGLENKYVVDVGSSIGWLEEELMKYNPERIVGVEPDAGAVAYSRKKVKGARFLQAFATKLPLPNNVADIVAMFDVLEHVPRGRELIALKEAGRVLKKKGKLILSTPHNYFLTNILDPAWYLGHRHYGKRYLKGLLESAGFKIDKLEVRGGVWFSIYLIWHYFMKWVLRKPFAVNNFLISMDDEQFSRKNGVHTIFLVATKL